MLNGGKRVLKNLISIPKVSVITVIKDAESHLQIFLNEISAFLNEEVELIIVDGGGSDDTLQILKRNSGCIDYWVSGPDKGIYDAMNKGIRLSKGRWLLFLGVDDKLLDGFSIMKDRLELDNSIYFGNVIHNGNRIIGKATPSALSKFNLCHQSIFYPKSVFKKYSYNVEFHVCSDYCLNIRCMGDTDFKFKYYDLNIADHADGGFSSKVVDTCFNRNKERLIKENLGYFTLLRYKFWRLKKSLKEIS